MILQYLMNNDNKHQFIYSIPTNANILEIGFSLRDKFIIWTIEQKDKLILYLLNMSIYFHQNYKPIQEKPKVLLEEKQKFHFTFDWINNLLYQIYRNKIYVSNIHKTDERTPIYSTPTNSTQIKFLTLCPENSLIFWSEIEIFDNLFSIYKANQDGSEEKNLLSSHYIFVNEFTIDCKEKRLIF